MSIEVERFEDARAEEWNDLLERSPGGTPFHRAEVLSALGNESGMEPFRFVGYKGQEPVGLFPMFGTSKGPIGAAFSPPPSLKIPYLGPALLNMGKLKRRKQDRRHRRFVEACLEHVDERLSPQYVHVRTPVRYEDVRPFVWNGFDATPRHTFEVDLTVGESELLDRFSSDARRNITDDYESDVEIREGGADTVERVVEQVRERHAEQDESFPLSPSFVVDLFEASADGHLRTFRCDVDGAFTGGTIVLEAGDTVYSWLGSSKVDADVPVNDLLNWKVCQEGMARDLHTFDLGGANDPRLCDFKAKFAPSLGTYYRLQRSTRTGDALAELYDRVSDRFGG